MFSSLTLVSMVLIHSAQRKGGFRHSECFFLLTDSRWVTFTFFVSSTYYNVTIVAFFNFDTLQ